jgi:hypothetical protein
MTIKKMLASFAVLSLSAAGVGVTHDAGAQAITTHGSACMAMDTNGSPQQAPVNGNTYSVANQWGMLNLWSTNITALCPLTGAYGPNGIMDVYVTVWAESGPITCTVFNTDGQGDITWSGPQTAPTNTSTSTTLHFTPHGGTDFGFFECTLPPGNSGGHAYISSYWSD